MSVTDQSTEADVLQPCDNDWHPACKRCHYCKKCIRGRFSATPHFLRSRRCDTKYCSGKCRVAACRERKQTNLVTDQIPVADMLQSGMTTVGMSIRQHE